ncbi:MAG: DUF4278 domain-containing protein [Cyanobacteriota bacterium]|nr:DUF4278 domain-containing protein [Cyanobacteriota bacterium]
MQLSYRGINYPTEHRTLKTVELEHQGLFLGQTYHLHRLAQPVPIFKPSLGLKKYRGATY